LEAFQPITETFLGLGEFLTLSTQCDHGANFLKNRGEALPVCLDQNIQQIKSLQRAHSYGTVLLIQILAPFIDHRSDTQAAAAAASAAAVIPILKREC
jgi:hypothetical protein